MIYINTGVCTQWLSGFKPRSTALESKFPGVRVIKLPSNTSPDPQLSSECSVTKDVYRLFRRLQHRGTTGYANVVAVCLLVQG